MSRLAPGMVIDGFRVEEKLHKGGMATLWHVTRVDGKQDGDSERRLLMKIPILGDNSDPAAIVGFEVEQMIMPKLTGIHVPHFVASGDFTGQPYIVMEEIAGKSLRSRFDEAPLPIDEVVSIGIRVATALHDLHRQNVIHLDLKPSNIMFRETGEAILIDYGLARHDKLPDLLAEEFRLPMGTGPYISPEQVLHIRNDPRSDLFALGVLMYHLATGERPYGFPTSVPGLRRRLYRDPVPPRALNADIPAWLQELILRCLEVNPAKRHDTAAQLVLDLQNPDQVKLTKRAEKRVRDGMFKVARRWFRSIGMEYVPQQSAATQLTRAPIIVVAIDLNFGSEALAESLRVAARRVLQTEPGARLACVTVRKTNRIGMDDLVDREGRNIHVKHLVGLKHWARPLNISAEKITYHVLEAPDPATAIIDYAKVNAVDHIVIGSRGSSAFRRYLGSVSSEVVALAECTVTVVKTPGSSSQAGLQAVMPPPPGETEGAQAGTMH
ncbi:bifunctional serine/threonine-protein kinase/universal stress protein [Noviherbaspirillum sp.]|uniref:bifunctional serine/threonine-protein kinase/universal stress protein n=1 Tax=Noviherbaspirillum sp. TaxID=1926288 RepID=UPI002D6ACFC6|nr:bifunctional serine/threonine-protein kinase/universal stress protein [Noviherbaspirillum sp.]HZW20666.1 bifunctional serine/threonine-protein kinase/universal stress protein [Noviherbaspirillum sp.]